MINVDKQRTEELYEVFNSAVKHLENLKSIMEQMPETYEGGNPKGFINFIDGLDEYRTYRDILKMIMDSPYVHEKDILDVIGWLKEK